MSEQGRATPVDAAPYQGDAGWLAESTSALLPPGAPSVLGDARAFREAGAQLTARLLRRHGAHELARVEDAVQEAFVAAARAWPATGVPNEPMAWLQQVAERRFLDAIRRDRRMEWDADAGRDEPAPPPTPEPGPGVLDDEVLRLLFLCCHPALSAESRVALTLKCVAQLGVQEIARALRAEPTAVAQRLVRAKRTLREVRASFVVPGDHEVASRLEDVLAVCYALFAEGHLATEGDTHVRIDLCHEALRLVLVLVSNPTTARAETHALLALLCLTAARTDARDARDENGASLAVSLREQDRTKWHPRLIARGVRAFAAAADGARYSRYHAEAEIALHHTLASSWETTPWEAIVAAYDRLLQVSPTAMGRLARWVAMAEADRAHEALAEIARSRAALEKELAGWPDWWATLGLLSARAGQLDEARASYDRALTFAVAEPVQRYWRAARQALG